MTITSRRKRTRRGWSCPFRQARGKKSYGRHPLLTLTEAVRFTGEEAKPKTRVYVFARSWEPTPFRRFAEAVKDDPAWDYHEADSGHDVMAGQPAQVRDILLGCA